MSNIVLVRVSGPWESKHILISSVFFQLMINLTYYEAELVHCLQGI